MVRKIRHVRGSEKKKQRKIKKVKKETEGRRVMKRGEGKR